MLFWRISELQAALYKGLHDKDVSVPSQSVQKLQVTKLLGLRKAEMHSVLSLHGLTFLINHEAQGKVMWLITFSAEGENVQRGKKKKPLHKPAEQHKEGALHFTSVWGRGTIRIIKGPKLTKALSKMSTSWQKKDQMSFPDKLFAPAGKKESVFLSQCIVERESTHWEFQKQKVPVSIRLLWF